MALFKSILLFSLALFCVGLLSMPVFFLQIGRYLMRKDSLKNYFFAIAIGLDQLGGALLFAQPDWTVSSMLHIKSQDGNKIALFFRDFVDKSAQLLGDSENHCARSYENEVKAV